MMLKKIGQCVTVSDSRAQKAIDNFILPQNVEPLPVENTEKQDKESDEKLSEDNSYFVFASINNNSQDCSFLVTAAYECDKLLNRAAKKKAKDESKKEDVAEDSKNKDAEKGESKSESALNSKSENDQR